MDNIDDLKRELEQTQLAYQGAMTLARWKGGFLERGAHELRSPLSSLIGLHQLILADLCEDPAEEREFVAQAHQAANKLMAMLDEMIAVSKLESGSIALDIQPLSLGPLFQAVERVTRLTAANRNLQLAFLAPASELAILADERRLSHALVMLIDTAIAHAERGTIQMTSESQPDGTVAITLELPCPVTLWQGVAEIPMIGLDANREAVTRSRQSLSPSLQWDLVRSLIQTLDGELYLTAMPRSDNEEPITRIDCFLPRSPIGAGTPKDTD
jgi:signal transduction histidine kinase